MHSQGTAGRLASLAMVALSLCGGAARAWTNLPVNSILQFNFQNPGARSLAMGGAFIGLAEDASAVRANPAGLISLSKPQFGLELRRNRLVSSYAAYSGDEAGTLMGHDFEENVFGLGYASVVIPFHPFAVSFFTHRLLDFKSSIEGRGVTFRNVESSLPVTNVRTAASRSDTEIGITTYGAAIAHQIGRFSYGLAVGYNTFRLDTITNSYLVDFFPQTVPAPDPTFSRDDITVIHFQKGDDSGFSASVGLRYAQPQWGAGLVYRSGISFDYHVIQQKGPRAPANLKSDEFDTTFSVPRSYGGGVYFRPVPSFGRLIDFTITADALRVDYSDLLDGFHPIYVSSDNQYSIRDVTEVHVGMEWVFNPAFSDGIVPVAVRFGFWRDPDHRLEYTGVATTNTRKGLSLLFPGSDRVYSHATFGLGVVFSEEFQLDFGADLADNVSTGIVSLVVRR
jgi:long-chain fatty acid transport protein